jgi:hypothetical protein
MQNKFALHKSKLFLHFTLKIPVCFALLQLMDLWWRLVFGVVLGKCDDGYAHWSWNRKLEESLRRSKIAGFSERSSSMQQRQTQQQAALGQGRRQKARSVGGGALVRMLWISGYLTVTLGALFSTFFYPELLSILRSQKLSVQPYVLPKVSSPLVHVAIM